MKVSEIHIKNHFQFQDLKLDLTYPKGHPKAGQPLDKVCIIGQSGTGKTTLLNMIAAAILLAAPERGYIDKVHDIDLSSFPKKASATITVEKEDNKHELVLKRNKPKSPRVETKIVDWLLNIPSGLASIPSPLEMNNSENYLREPSSPPYKDINYAILDIATIKRVWNDLEKKVTEYQEEEGNYRVQLTRDIEKGKDINIKKAMEEWRQQHINPLDDIGDNCLNPLLAILHLAVQKEFQYDERKSLQIKSLQDHQTIPFKKLSTGTKQLIYTLFPTYDTLKLQQDTLILLDEPENALYPDIQREIIDYYTSFDQTEGQKTQFFFATHSPIIASSFEPWEIVELKFNAQGEVYRELYYEGENQVDNYVIDPRYLNIEHILMKIFDVPAPANPNSVKLRTDLLLDFSILKDKVEKLKKEGKLKNPTPDEQDIIDKFRFISTRLSLENSKA